MEKNNYKIAVIPGDGIGNEVMPEAIRVLEKIAERFECIPVGKYHLPCSVNL